MMASEKRLIDATPEHIRVVLEKVPYYPDEIWKFTAMTERFPTVDAVEVVRCKDCRFWRDTWVAPDGITEHGYCHLEESDDVVVGRWDDDFCSYGERKDNG